MGVFDFDLLTLIAAELQKLLTEKKVTSVDLVELYLAQIEKHNRNGMKLHAIICTAPEPNVFRLARTLDEEREDGNLRGPMHGIPIIVKVV